MLRTYCRFVISAKELGFEVICGRVGALGLLLQTLGITAFDSGLGEAESFDLSQLNRRPKKKEVAELYEAQHDLIVKRRVKKIGRLRLQRENGQDLGDIDVLTIDRNSKVIGAIETKNLAVSRTPAEMARECSETFSLGRETSSHADRHVERIGWLGRQIGEVLKGFEIYHSVGWKVEGMIVVDIETMSPMFAVGDIFVKSFPELRRELARSDGHGI